MRSDIRRGSFRRILVHAFISGVITWLVEMFLLTNVSLFGKIMERSRTADAYINGLENLGLIWIGVFTVVGVFVFCICFVALEDRTVKYIAEISDAMWQISSGDLNTVVEVKGDSGYSEMADNLNKLAENIRLLIEKERKAEATKNELITNVAHDLRTPLTSIIGYLELLSGEAPIPEDKRKEYLKITCQKSRRLEHLIEDLFGFTKLTYGKITMSVGQVDIVKLMTQLVDEFYPNFEEAGLIYQLKSNVESYLIDADGNLLARLFENLVGNAIKYGSMGKKIDIGIEGKENEVLVSVTNYGYVIPADKLPYLFDKFFRVEQARTEKAGGTGLGLAIAKNIAEMHGGSIEVKSDLQGTRFMVRLNKEFDINKENFQHS